MTAAQDRARAANATIARQRHRELATSRIADYLWIGGPHLSAAQAAARLGVTPRTITRWRARLRYQPHQDAA